MNYSYVVKFYNEAGLYLDTEHITVKGQGIDDPELQRDEAWCEADDLAEEMMEELNASEYELTLEDVW